MKAERRTKFQIYFDILEVLCQESKFSRNCSLTKVAHRANLPYDRFKASLESLIRLAMISKVSEGEFVVTGKGLEYVEEYKKINDFLERMGVLP
jgi:predicted transcriptional regulator